MTEIFFPKGRFTETDPYFAKACRMYLYKRLTIRMWENVQIFVYRVSDSHKCLLQKVTPTIKSLFAIESNAAYKICLCFKSYIQFRKPKMTAGTQCRTFFFLFFATWVVNTHHGSEFLPSPCFHTNSCIQCFSDVGVMDPVRIWPKSQQQQQQLVRG